LCFESRFSEQNSVIRLKSNILALPNFWAGYATVSNVDCCSCKLHFKMTEFRVRFFFVLCVVLFYCNVFIFICNYFCCLVFETLWCFTCILLFCMYLWGQWTNDSYGRRFLPLHSWPRILSTRSGSVACRGKGERGAGPGHPRQGCIQRV